MDPVTGLSSPHSRINIHENLPFNSVIYVQLQIILLYSQEDERGAARKCLGSHVDKICTTLARPVHSYETEINVIYVKLVNKVLTLQTYKWWRSPEAGQIVFVEYVIHFDVEVNS
jgi:hypothetical protein